MNGPMTTEQVRGLPAVIDLMTAARALGIGRTTAYTLARTGGFPCRVITVGSGYRIPTADLLTVLGLPLPGRDGPDPDMPWGPSDPDGVPRPGLGTG